MLAMGRNIFLKIDDYYVIKDNEIVFCEDSLFFTTHSLFCSSVVHIVCRITRKKKPIAEIRHSR